MGRGGRRDLEQDLTDPAYDHDGLLEHSADRTDSGEFGLITKP